MADKKISALTGATTPLAGTEVLPIVQSGATVKVAVSDLTAGRAVSATQLTSTVAIGTAPLVVTSTTNVANLNASSLNGATFAAPGAIGGGTASAITGTTITGTDATDASSTTAAAIKTAGGFAVVKKIYVGDNIVPATAAKGINFTANTPAAGMTSQLLNWYEEGTWSPVLSDGTNNATCAATTGTYIKIGRSVTITGYLSVTNIGSVGASTRITGLPFATTAHGAGIVGYGSGFSMAAGDYTLTLACDPSTSFFSIYRADANGAVNVAGSEIRTGGFLIFSATYIA